jgi:hypothetical protein
VELDALRVDGEHRTVAELEESRPDTREGDVVCREGDPTAPKAGSLTLIGRIAADSVGGTKTFRRSEVRPGTRHYGVSTLYWTAAELMSFTTVAPPGSTLTRTVREPTAAGRTRVRAPTVGVEPSTVKYRPSRAVEVDDLDLRDMGRERHRVDGGGGQGDRVRAIWPLVSVVFVAPLGGAPLNLGLWATLAAGTEICSLEHVDRVQLALLPRDLLLQRLDAGQGGVPLGEGDRVVLGGDVAELGRHLLHRDHRHVDVGSMTDRSLPVSK